MSGQRFLRDDKGSIAITAALTLLAVVAMLGGAVDYTSAVRVRSRFESYADAAVLAAVGSAARSLTAEQAKLQAERTFRDSLPADLAPSLSGVNAVVSDVGGERNVTLTYNATYTTWFMGMVGFNQLPVAGVVNGRGTTPLYSDFYLLLDNSPSMGLGATQTDMDKLNGAVGCAFGCHVLGSTSDNYSVAKSIGANMRIDVVRTATQSLMDTALATQSMPAQYRMAIYTFGPTGRQERLTELFALSSNLNAAKTAANGIDIMALDFDGVKGYAMTNFDEKFATLSTRIGTPGDGRTAATPQKVVYFVSDGVADWSSAACNGPLATGWDPDLAANFPRCFEPVKLQLCDDFKRRGIKVAVLHTVYLPLSPGVNEAYDAFVAPMASRLAPAMQACASEGLYFPVQPNQGIEAAMHALFIKAARTVSLTR